jgi:hypothetical protein
LRFSREWNSPAFEEDDALLIFFEDFQRVQSSNLKIFMLRISWNAIVQYLEKVFVDLV